MKNWIPAFAGMTNHIIRQGVPLRKSGGDHGADIYAKWNHYLTELGEFIEPVLASLHVTNDTNGGASCRQG